MTYRPTVRTQLRKNICFDAHTVIAGCFGRRQQSSTETRSAKLPGHRSKLPAHRAACRCRAGRTVYRRSCCQSRPASGAVREIIRGAVPIVVGVVPCFQSSMLLHNLSSIFSLSKKASQRALRCTHLPHRMTAITHPAANAHQAAPVSADHRPEPQRTRPQHCIRPQRPNPPQNRFSTISPQSFPHFRRFSTVAFFPLGFL